MPELQRPDEEVVHDVIKSHDHQNGLTFMAGALSNLGAVAQDYNPESVGVEKLGVGASESRPGCSFCVR